MNDRHNLALLMRDQGKTYGEIAKTLNVSRARAEQIAKKADRLRRRAPDEFNALGPRITNSLRDANMLTKSDVRAWLAEEKPRKVPNIGNEGMKLIREWVDA